MTGFFGQSESDETSQKKAVIEAVLLACYFLLALFFIIYQVRSLKYQEMRNRFHIIITVSLLIMILMRIILKLGPRIGISFTTQHSFVWNYYLKFQLLYDLVNLAIIS